MKKSQTFVMSKFYVTCVLHWKDYFASAKVGIPIIYLSTCTPTRVPRVSKNPQKYFTNKSVELLR